MERGAFKVLQVLGEAVNPYDRTFERLHVLAAKAEASGSEFPTLDVVAFFEGDGEGGGQDRQAADRRACAVRWSLDRHGELVGWLVDSGVTLEDAPPAAGE